MRELRTKDLDEHGRCRACGKHRDHHPREGVNFYCDVPLTPTTGPFTLDDAQRAVREFHQKHAMDSVHLNTSLLRLHLVQEETSELAMGFYRGDRRLLADALTDLLYVVLGTFDLYDLNATTLFKEVHRSNMTKAVSGDPRVTDKGNAYQPPNLDVAKRRP